MSMTRATAEGFAAQALAWLAGDGDRLGGFLGWSGITPDGLRERLHDPALLLAVLDFLMLDEAMLLAACRDLGVPPQTPMQARTALPGGAQRHWT